RRAVWAECCRDYIWYVPSRRSSSARFYLESCVMSERNYDVIQPSAGVPIKTWTRGVLLDEKATEQLRNAASMPFIHKWIAVMPDVHWGLGATVGSVIPTSGAIIPAAVGVDIGCGMIATRTTLEARHLPDSLKAMRSAI